MQHLVRNSLIVLLILALCGVSIFPPEKNLRKGRDLVGGVSLTYAVEVAPGEDAGRVIDNTIEVLKDRVDPQGLYEISFVRQGQDRIEITMPLPTDRVRQLRAAYDEELAKLSQQSVNAHELDRALRMAPEQRERALATLAHGSDARLRLLEAAAAAHDAAEAARQAYREAAEAGASDAELNELIIRAGALVAVADTARDDVLSASVSPGEVQRALELPDRDRNITDGDEVKTIPSPRKQAIARLLEQHPPAAEQIQNVINAYNAYRAESRGLDDPADLIRLLQGAGVLTFRIAPEPGQLPEEAQLRQDLMEKGPRAARSSNARWFEIDDISTWYNTAAEQEYLARDPVSYFRSRRMVGAERDGVYYLLLYDAPGLRMTHAEGEWSLSSAFQTVDDLGRPAVGFRMDPVGAQILGRLTGDHTGELMAILLDDKVYSAPNLNSRISSNGIIQGEFTQQDIQYLTRTLSAGSLQAKLSPQPLSTNVIGPELGADNVRQGFTASIASLIAVGAFMTVYYLGAGIVAVIALLANAIIILGIMSLTRAAFTLPGIAGVVLTFGMAVDANVLIFERIREELQAGADLKNAVRLGYDRVFSTIMDGNITNLIICAVLYYTATQEIKGFAITMSIGVVSTLFSALFISRLIFVLLLEKFNVRKLPQLPMLIPMIQRLVTPNVNWLKLRPVFYSLSVAGILGSFAMVYAQRNEMLDTEFRGGTAITVQMKNEGGVQLTSTRPEIAALIHAFGDAAPADSPEAGLRSAEVVPLNPQVDGVTSDQFVIKTTIEDGDAIQAAVVKALGDLIDARPPMRFLGMESETIHGAPVYRIVDSRLGENLGRPSIRNDVSAYIGGVAIVLEDIDPPASLGSLQRRLEQMRAESDFSRLLGRPHELVLIEGMPDAVESAVLLSLDPEVSAFDDPARWQAEVAQEEWRLVRAALTETTTLVGKQSFSAAIAETFKARAIVAVALSLLGIMIYVWVRFGRLRYAVASVTSLAHDVVITVGLIAFAEYLTASSPAAAGALLLEPFKVNLGVIAALLTIIGYGINDTIVIFDRIRENRGKLSYASADVVNASINQTFSRTVFTAGTTLIAVGIMYIFGGSGIRDFTFTMLCGILLGTYSTVAIAAPMVYTRKMPVRAYRVGEREEDAARRESLATT